MCGLDHPAPLLAFPVEAEDVLLGVERAAVEPLEPVTAQGPGASSSRDLRQAGRSERRLEHPGRRLTQVPDQPGRAQHLEHPVGDVDLPPEEAQGRRARIVVVVVVPALAERQQRQERRCSASRRRSRSGASRRRAPSELMVKVPCHSTTVETKEPQIAAGSPPTRKSVPSSTHDGAKWCRSSQRSSGTGPSLAPGRAASPRSAWRGPSRGGSRAAPGSGASGRPRDHRSAGGDRGGSPPTTARPAGRRFRRGRRARTGRRGRS